MLQPRIQARSSGGLSTKRVEAQLASPTNKVF